jgi:ankyrin repeat protein
MRVHSLFRVQRNTFLCGVFLSFALATSSQQVSGTSDSALLQAITLNDSISLKQLLGKGANPNAIDDDGDNALMYAVLYADDICLRLLLDYKASVNQKNKLGQTAVLWAAHNLSKLKLLISYGADTQVVPVDGNDLMMIACKGNNQGAIVQFLLSIGANCKEVNNSNETTLMKAAILGDTILLQLLLDKGVDINARSASGNSALHFAILFENMDAAQWILGHMPSGKTSDSIVQNDFGFAVDCRNMDLVTALIARSRDVDWEDGEGITALMWAVYDEHCELDIVKALLDAGANPRHKAKDGSTPLSWALKKGNTPVVTLLQNAIKAGS